MADEKYTLDQILEAIKGSRGIKATIQRRLGCGSRNTVENYLKRYATAQQAYDEEVETVGDVAESLIFDDMVRNKNVETAKWYAKAKLKHRGYTDAVEQKHSGPNGGPIEHRDVTDFTDEELASIASRRSGGTPTA